MKKVFIDGGAHKGEAIEVLLDKRPDMAGCEIHFFEPNPDLIQLLNDMGEKDENYDIKVYHSALWVDNLGVNFLESVERWGSLGGTIIPSIQEKWGLKIAKDNPKSVPSTSLVDFLNNFDEDDYIVIKLDIEGSEYFVVEDLLRSKKISMVNELYVEWHDHFFPHFQTLGNELRGKLAELKLEVHNDWM